MDAELKSLKIDRSQRAPRDASPWAARWILSGVTLIVLLGAGGYVYNRLNAALEVETARAVAQRAGGAASAGDVVLNATGYIVAAHKIQVASKVVGKVAWIGVDKGDNVSEGQVIVRLEDDEYRAQLQQASGQLMNAQARLAELENGSRPEEVAAARANVEQAQADLENARVQLDRTRKLHAEGVFPKSNLDDAVARFNSAQARVNSLQKTYELIRIGPRREQIDALKGQVEQIKGMVAFYQTQLNNTIIKAPVTGTILERAVERGEFVTTSFVGERGAKGYVVSLANLNDLEVELDISQNDFNKLSMGQRGIVTVDAYAGLRWDGRIDEISPEANRQKATVQVKVKILAPDQHLRPEMNASVAFLAPAGAAVSASGAAAQPIVFVPPSTVRDGRVFVVVDGAVVERTVKTGGATPQGLKVEDGLTGGEDVVVNPPPELRNGARVRKKGT